MMTIGRNRKQILTKLQNIEQRKGKITFACVKDVLEEILQQSHITLEDKNWTDLIKFVEKDGNIDYKLLLEFFKERFKKIMATRASKVIML